MARVHNRDSGMLATVQGVQDHLQVFTRHSVTESAVECPAVLPLPKTFLDEYGASAHRGSNYLNEEREDADISAPRGPFTIKGFGKIGDRHQCEARGPRSSLSDGSSSSSGDEDSTNSSPYSDASGRTVTCCSYAGKQATHAQHGGSVDAVVIEAKQRHGMQDYMRYLDTNRTDWHTSQFHTIFTSFSIYFAFMCLYPFQEFSLNKSFTQDVLNWIIRIYCV